MLNTIKAEKNCTADDQAGKSIDFSKEILLLKKKKNAIILAHYYQDAQIQDIADYVGDSLGLSQQAAKTKAGIIVFAGVHFMAETAKILNPNKKVLIPDPNAGCSLAESCDTKTFKEFIRQHPHHTVITYINCSAEIKALSDIVCTSSNAEKVINSIPKDDPILFAPDENLGKYLIRKTGRNMLLWKGSCIVHEAFAIDKILKLAEEHPAAKIVAHPESEEHLLRAAHFIGSTSEMINYVKKDSSKEFIIATEAGILYRMAKEVPGKILIPAPSKENNACACSECAYMKLNTMEKLYRCMKDEKPEILIPENIIAKALIPIKRMLELSATIC